MHINSNDRKVVLSSWLKKYQPREFSRDLKLQKFLFFYELDSKINGDEADFNYLRAYPNGPVFSNVYGDLIYNVTTFFSAIEDAEDFLNEDVDYERAKFAGFLVKILDEKELSDLTHEFDAWKKHEWKVKKGYKRITISESDFTESDFNLLRTLRNMYPEELIDNSEVISIMDRNFIISKEDLNNLNEDQKSVFLTLADTDLDNPIYVELDEEGVLLID